MTNSTSGPDAATTTTPRASLRLVAEGLGERSFSPLVPPVSFDIDLERVDPDLVQRLHARFRIDLAEGSFTIPMIAGLDLPVDIPASCSGRGWLAAARRSEGAVQETRVSSADLSFDPPLVLHNIVPVLTRLNTLFEDRELAALLSRLRGLAPARYAAAGAGRLGRGLRARLRPRLDRFMPPGSPERQRLHQLKEGVKSGAQQLADVSLSHVSVRPVLRGDDWLLDLRFSGHFHVLGRAPVPFEDVHVPHLIIPYPYASLRKLLTGDPLATASLRTERIPVDDLAQALLEPLTGFRGSVDAHTELPLGALDAQLPSGGMLRAALKLPGAMSLKGRFDGRVAAEGVEIDARDMVLSLDDGDLRLEGRARLGTVAEPGEDFSSSALGCCVRAGLDGRWPDDQVRLELEGRILPASRLAKLELDADYVHPQLRGGAHLAGQLENMLLEGALQAELAPETGLGSAQRLELSFAGDFGLREDSRLDDGTTRVRIEACHGQLEGELSLQGSDEVAVELGGALELDLASETQMAAFPEAGIEDCALLAFLGGRASFQGRLRSSRADSEILELDFAGSAGALELAQGRLELPDRMLRLPAGSRFEASVLEGVLDTSGLGRSRFGLRWDLCGESPLLFGGSGQEPVTLLVPDLRKGELEAQLSAVGGLTISGEEGGLYDARYFNALLNPDQEQERWLELLDSDEALDHVFAAVRVFSQDAADLLENLRRFARRFSEALRAEAVVNPGDAIPGPVLARIISRLLVESEELEERLFPLVKRVTDGLGLDVLAVKRLLDEVLPEHDYGYELDRGIRLAALVLGPTEPPPRRVRAEALSLAEMPAYRRQLRALPSAGELYQVVQDQAPLPQGFSERVARVAPYLTSRQIHWLLDQGRRDWREADLLRLRIVRALKQRVRMIAESYGGLAFAPQATAISLFLAATVNRRPLPDEVERALPGEPEGLLAHAECLLGPQDVAVLLQAGLAAALQGRVVQLNQRLLLDLILRQPPEFLRQVLVEICDGSPRILAGVLNALLDLEQGALHEPLDLVALFSERLDIELPRLSDYMAGGRWARQSYYQALNAKAEAILDEAEPYLALRARLRSARVVPDPLPVLVGESAALEAAAQAAIARADQLGGLCSFKGNEPVRRRRAREAYEEAFAACRALLRAQPGAFRLDWFKRFWSRNYEALMVLSVLRNVQQRVDRVREWLTVRNGSPLPRSEQALLRACIDALYERPADREELKADPLVRLLMDPPPGKYDFTVISCMGVVTEGARGRELEDAFRRLEARRGVSLIRADTATARSLTYNALQVEKAVRRAQTPWGYVGYSQGCANGLWAEALLMGGTPEQQALLENLRCRHLLFSAVNGSAHGTCGDLKFLRAMVDGDNFLAYYQALFSERAIQLGLRAIRQLLDAPVFVKTMGGVESLSVQGTSTLGREQQIKSTAPTTIIRGVVRPEILPEALEFLSNVLTRQIESEDHDTQVYVDEAVGHPVHITNPQAELARSCDVGCRVQTTHHWSPLLYTTEFLTTERDLKRGIYDFPKDRHVFPWIEVNARFGRIQTRSSEGEVEPEADQTEA